MFQRNLEPRCSAHSSWPWSLTARHLAFWAFPCWPLQGSGLLSPGQGWLSHGSLAEEEAGNIIPASILAHEVVAA